MSQIKTKEEIIRNGKHFFEDQVDAFQRESDGGFIPAIEGLMDEYAEQESIYFAEWIERNGYFLAHSGEWHKWGTNDNDDKSAKELFSLYKSQH